jgi:hypothetical protein
VNLITPILHFTAFTVGSELAAMSDRLISVNGLPFSMSAHPPPLIVLVLFLLLILSTDPQPRTNLHHSAPTGTKSN